MANLLFLVHGMGEYTPGWSADIVAKLNAMAAQYPAFQSGRPEFEKHLTIQEITYDQVFSDRVDSWKNDASQLDAWAKASGQSLPKVVGWLRSPLPADATGFFWTTAIDPLLYRGFRLVRDDVRAQVCDQVVSGLEKALAHGATTVTVLSHSLGTAVMHDSLHMIAQGYKGNDVLSAKSFAVNNIFMVADICLLASKLVADIDYFESFVRPSSAGGAHTTYCQYFVNIWHRFDPFVLAGPFRPTTWGPGYVPIGPLEHFHNANVHGFTHYLDHPLVHVPLINAALGVKPDGTLPISASDQQKVLDNYPVTPAQGCDVQIEQLKASALAVANATDLEETVIAIAEFLAAARQAADACKALFSPDMFK